MWFLVSQDNNVIKDLLFERNGTQGDQWIQANVTLPAYSALSVMFEGVIGDSYMGDIAIDDITMVDGACFGVTGELR